MVWGWLVVGIITLTVVGSLAEICRYFFGKKEDVVLRPTSVTHGACWNTMFRTAHTLPWELSTTGQYLTYEFAAQYFFKHSIDNFSLFDQGFSIGGQEVWGGIIMDGE